MTRIAPAPSTPVEPTPRRSFTPAQRVQIMERQAGLCAACGEPLSIGWQVDHILPLELGGAHEPGNWAGLHFACHARKTAHDIAAIAKARRIRKRLDGTAPPPTQKLQSRGFRRRWE